MKRRDFLKYIGIGGVGTGIGLMFGKATKPPGAKLIPYLIPPEDIIPGVGDWYASVCRQCGAGCGTMVKVMDGRAKKMEGNPRHPVNKGKLCARGQAALQSLYNPDRIKSPLKRVGKRGAADFVEITWDKGLSILSKNLSDLAKAREADKLYLLTSPIRGHMSTLISGFMSSYGSPNHIQHELFQHKNLYFANQASMGLNSIPYYNIEKTQYLLSFGADFATTWVSPVNYGHGYGQMRQGNSKRGWFVQVEPRLSLSGANADEWIAPKPGTEGILALAIAHVIVEKGYYKGGDSAGWRGLLSKYTPGYASSITEIYAARIEKMAKEFAETRPSLAIGGENLASYENGVSCLVAVNILNHVAGNLGIEGGVIPNQDDLLNTKGSGVDFKSRVTAITEGAGSKVKTLVLYNSNPVFTMPKEAKVEESLNKIPFIASLSSFMDETTAMADLVLPAHTTLEDWGDDFTEPSVGFPVAAIMQPAVSPVFNTMSLGDIFLGLAKRTGAGSRFKSDKYSDYIRDSWKELYTRNRAMSAGTLSFDEFWVKTLAAGGWWQTEGPRKRAVSISARSVEQYISHKPASFDGSEQDYPLYLLLYPQTGFTDGRGANLPWLQELPDPVTTVVWDTWVEMNPKTANRIGLKEGDMVAVESPYGKISAPLYVYPGIRPDTIAIPIGQGHKHYGRYAKDRGANPIEILPFKQDARSGALPLNSTRVKVYRTSAPGKLVKLAGTSRDLGRGLVKTIPPEEFKKLKREDV